VKDKYVVAWYCETKANPANAAESIKNVGPVCSYQGYNKCYNDIALVAINKYRKNHETDAL
jgi:hypothetical protein